WARSTTTASAASGRLVVGLAAVSLLSASGMAAGRVRLSGGAGMVGALLGPVVPGFGHLNEGVRDGGSGGAPGEQAAEADQRPSGAEDIPEAVQQPPPAAQRPGVGQMGDRLLHQRAQPRPKGA